MNELKILDSDIATIEALHDLLMDNHGYCVNFITLIRARTLTSKLHKIIENQDKNYKL
jgi:hypothetical protein